MFVRRPLRRSRRTSRPGARRGPLAPLLAVALAAGLALAGCTGGVEGTGDKGYVSGTGQVTRLAVADRGESIDYEGEDLDGEPLALSDLRGRPTVVVVWGAWCSPCRAEAPDVVDAAERLEGEARFVGLNIRDSARESARGFVRSFEIPYPSFFSPDGKAMLPFTGVLTPNSIPSFVVLDAEGRAAASIIGALPSTRTLVELTRDVAAGKTDG